MNPRTVTFSVDEATAERLDTAAGSMGLSVEDFVVSLVRQRLSPNGVNEDVALFHRGHDWTEADRRLARYDRTGIFVDAAAALDAFVDKVDARAAQRA